MAPTNAIVDPRKPLNLTDCVEVDWHQGSQRKRVRSVKLNLSL